MLMKLLTSPLRLESFAELNMSAELSAVLEKMAIVIPTPVQQQAIPVALNGQDLIAVAQTGSGKTLAFVLAMLDMFKKRPQSRALVLVPSREMALQIFSVFEEVSVAAPFTKVLVIGGLPGNKQDSQLKKNPRLVVATPGRMNDLLRNNKLLLKNVEMIVIDEADRMLDLGFAPQLKDIKSTLRGLWQTMMFSASFSREVEAIAKIFMRDEAVMVRAELAEKPVSGLVQKILYLTPAMKNKVLMDEINDVKGSVMVFAGSQDSCEKVGQHLKSHGFKSDYVHGGLTQAHRSRIVEKFRDGVIRVLVTTDLLARGLDVPSVESVINFDLPFQSEDFLHRIGRTARAGRSGVATTFVTHFDSRMFKEIQPYLQGAREVTLSSDMGERPKPPDAGRPSARSAALRDARGKPIKKHR